MSAVEKQLFDVYRSYLPSRESARARLLSALDAAERAVRLFSNRARLPSWKSRLLKFLSSPHKYGYRVARRILFPKAHNTARVRFFWGKTARLPLFDENVVMLYFCGVPGLAEGRLTRFFVRHLAPYDIFYDIGANFGFYTGLAGVLIESGEIHAFEPSPSTFPFLERAFAREAHVTLNKVALADVSGERAFFDAFQGGKSGVSSLQKGAVAGKTEHRDFEVSNVAVMTLDEYARLHTPPTVIKLDVEGGETEVLRGGMATLRKFRPLIAMEVNANQAIRERTKMALDILSKEGYRAHEITPEGGLVPTTLDLEHNPPGEFNIFIFKYGGV